MNSVRYIFRQPRTSFHSIENVFEAVIPYIEQRFRVERLYMPYGKISARGITGNMKALKSAGEMDIQHFTGHDHYLVLGSKGKTVLTIHDMGSALQGSFLRQKVIRRYWFERPLHKADYITTISSFTANEIISNFSVEEEKLHVIPDPVNDMFQFHEHEFYTDEPVILHVGVKENKNLENTARALKGIRCKMIILGKPSASQIKLLKELKISYEVKSNLSNEQVVELYQSCDILSFVSHYEGFGMPVLEAQAVGTPVMASDISAIREVAGESVLYADPFDVHSIRDSIVQMIQSSSLRKELISKGLKNVEQYRAKNIAEKYMNLYNLLLNE